MDAESIGPEVSAKPLRLLGRDGMNLVEFPITLLTDRVPKSQDVAVYQDVVYDDRSGLTLTRKLTISASRSEHGITTAADDDVILALIQITKEQNDFTSPKVYFSRRQLCLKLGWTVGGASYDRIEISLDKWMNVTLKYENAWRDNKTKRWTSKEAFHIIDSYKLYDSRQPADQMELDLGLPPSFIVWGEDIFESFQAGYLKPLDYDRCMSLRNSTAKRLYRFLDKRFYQKPDWTFELKELAHMHVGLGRNYEGPSHLKRNLMPAIVELEQIGFLTILTEAERFIRDGKNWKVRLIQNLAAGVAFPASEALEILPLPPLVAALTERGVTEATARELLQRHHTDTIKAKIDVYDWLVAKQDKRVAKSPAGYLVKSISTGYREPAGYISKAERQRRETEREAKERREAEARRQEREQEAAIKQRNLDIAAYWQALTPQEQAERDAEAVAQADPQDLKLIEGGDRVFRKIGMGIIRDKYIWHILQSQKADA